MRLTRAESEICRGVGDRQAHTAMARWVRGHPDVSANSIAAEQVHLVEHCNGIARGLAIGPIASDNSGRGHRAGRDGVDRDDVVLIDEGESVAGDVHLNVPAVPGWRMRHPPRPARTAQITSESAASTRRRALTLRRAIAARLVRALNAPVTGSA